jgi:hypothetical protein
MKWQVNLVGEPVTLDYLSKIFNSQDLHICWEEGRYILESSSFAQFSDSRNVKEATTKFLTAINATKKLTFSPSKPIECGSINAIDEKGNRTLYLEDTLSISSRIHGGLTIVRANGTIDEKTVDGSMVRWIPLIDTDEKVHRVFNLMNHDFNSYIGFYKIVEVIQEDGFTPLMKNGEFYNDIKLFKQTAQSYSAVREAARHAHSRFTSPETPMELPAARELVKRIVKMWLDSKI